MIKVSITATAIAAVTVIALGYATANGAGPYTIVAFGDSTTASRGPLVIYAQLLQNELPREGISVNVVNAGVRGNNTADGVNRWAKDVLGPNPNLVIIQFGINDSTVEVYKDPPATEPPVSKQQYRRNLEWMVRNLKEKNIQAILMTPNPIRWTPELLRLYGKPPYNPEFPDGLDLYLKDYAQIVREIADEQKVPLVDVYAAFESYGREPGKSVDGLLLDGMHPNDKGHRIIGDLLIPKIVDVVKEGKARR